MTETRDTQTALLRGAQKKCPNCGDGQIFDGFLKVNAYCPACSEPLFHHRADDGPAWLTILIVGHLVGFLMIPIFTLWRPEAWVLALVLSLLAIASCLFLLPRIKGGFIAFQWAKRMHGFCGEEDVANHHP